MKKNIVLCSAIALGAAVTIHAQNVDFTYQWGPRLAGMPLEAKVVKGMPYSAEMVMESSQTLSDGNRIVRRTTGRIYRDTEGRVRRDEDRASGGPTVSLTDPVAGTSFTLDPATRTARETPNFSVVLNGALEELFTFRLATPDWTASGGRTSAPPPPPPPPVGLAGGGGRGGRGSRGGASGNPPSEEKLPDQMIEGVLASGVRRTTTIDKGVIGNELPIKIVSEEWRSSELQVLVLTDLTDPRTGRSTYRLLKINRLEPDPALFQVPPDYTVQRARGGSPAPFVPAGRGRGSSGRGQ